ncbi:MAG TPA: YihY/virulence factor BrkB family protein [Bauldia sp.]|nr:YihY/virulence factor BrkB family protein [Bauldia sp.]
MEGFSPMKAGDRRLLHKSWAVFWDAFNHFNADDGWAMASHVALSALMALFPFLIFVAAFAGTLGESTLADRVATLVFAAWPAEVASPIAAEVHRVLVPIHGNLLTISAVVAAYLASNGVEAARTALNRAYRVVDRRSIFFRRAQSLIFVLIGTVVVLFIAALGVYLASVPILEAHAAELALAGVVITSVLVVAALTGAHLWLPAGRPHWTLLWPGIAGTLVAWLISGWVFAIYLRSFANYAATYAGLAGVVTAIFFLYVIALLMIFGAEFNATLGRLRDGHIG